MNIGNKLLNRQLKSTILELKYSSLLILLANFEAATSSQSTATYYKKGLKCAECILTYQEVSQSGFGRTNEQAHANAIKSLFDSIIERQFKLDQLKQSLKLVNKKIIPIDPTQDISYIDLLESRITRVNQDLPEISIIDNSNIEDFQEYRHPIKETKQIFPNQFRRDNKQKYQQILKEPSLQLRCQTHEFLLKQEEENYCCFHYELHLESEKKILNLQSRLKLMSQENALLKECLLKDYSNKENRNIGNQISSMKLNT